MGVVLVELDFEHLGGWLDYSDLLHLPALVAHEEGDLVAAVTLHLLECHFPRVDLPQQTCTVTDGLGLALPLVSFINRKCDILNLNGT